MDAAFLTPLTLDPMALRPCLSAGLLVSVVVYFYFTLE